MVEYIHGMGKICDFQTKLSFILEMLRHKPMVTMDHYYESIGTRSVYQF